MHAKSIAATLRASVAAETPALELLSPAPGLFRFAVQLGDIIREGTVLGTLEVLGQPVIVTAPAGASGAVVALADRTLARPAVDHGTTLVTLDPTATSAASIAPATSAATHATGLVFRAPTSGRFYGRPGPDKPAFVEAGTELAPGATICLLEVMKTFHRVTYGGGGLPDRARVRDVLVKDGDDVNAGDALLALDPA